MDSRKIAKHRNDIFRLYQVIDPGVVLRVPTKVHGDLSVFFEAMAHEDIDVGSLGLRGTNRDSVLADLRTKYLRSQVMRLSFSGGCPGSFGRN